MIHQINPHITKYIFFECRIFDNPSLNTFKISKPPIKPNKIPMSSFFDICFANMEDIKNVKMGFIVVTRTAPFPASP